MPPVATAWSLRRRLGVTLAILGALLGGLVAVSGVLLARVHSEQRLVTNHYFTAVTVAEAHLAAQIDAETAIRGYALTDDPVTLQPAQFLHSRSYAAQDAQLRGLLKGDSSTLAALAAWDRAAATWVTTWAQPTVAEVKARGRDVLTDHQVLAGKSLFDANRAAFATFLDELVGKRDAASSTLQSRTTVLFVTEILVVAALALGGLATWLSLRRWVLAPLTQLSDETRLVRSGARDHALKTRGPAEIQQLAADVDAMRRDIVEQLAAVEAAGREIEAARVLLEAQADDLARSNRDLEQFAYVASHDLQEPLRKVASFCQMLERRYSGQLDERADQYIAFAVDGAKRMQQLINDLLAFSRVGRTASAFTEVNLQRCFDAAVNALGVVIDSSGAVVTSTPLPDVDGDAGLLTQLLQNLISNAIKFRGDSPPTVHVDCRDLGEFWEFSCADNGIGVPAQYAERIFVIFQRLHPKDAYAGTGIGLALCKRIVEHHGGQIWVDTAAAHGATFRWTLRKQPTKPPSSPSSDPSESA